MEIQNNYIPDEIWLHILSYLPIPCLSLVCRALYYLELECMKMRIENTKRRFPTIDDVAKTKSRDIAALVVHYNLITTVNDPITCVSAAIKNRMYGIVRFILIDHPHDVKDCMEVHICRYSEVDSTTLMEILRVNWTYQWRMVQLAVDRSPPSFTPILVSLVRDGSIDTNIMRSILADVLDVRGGTLRYLNISIRQRYESILADIEDEQRNGDLHTS